MLLRSSCFFNRKAISLKCQICGSEKVLCIRSEFWGGTTAGLPIYVNRYRCQVCNYIWVETSLKKEKDYDSG